jgi:hypothetical protein
MAWGNHWVRAQLEFREPKFRVDEFFLRSSADKEEKLGCPALERK